MTKAFQRIQSRKGTTSESLLPAKILSKSTQANIASGGDWPLNFQWRADDAWIDDLRLPLAVSRRHETARAAILLEAALADIEGMPAVSYSRRPAFYANQRRYIGRAFGYAAVVQTIDDLAARKFLINDIAPGNGPCGRQSTFRASSILLECVPRDLASKVQYFDRELILLRDENHHRIPYHDTIHTVQMRRRLVDANEAIDSVEIGLDDQILSGSSGLIQFGKTKMLSARRTLHRVFNGDFQHGGRMYGPWWQQAPKLTRKNLTMDGEPVIEIDYDQIHPRLLYKLAICQMAGDAYTLDGWDRAEGKLAFNILMNAKNYQLAVGAVANAIGGTDRMARARVLISEIKEKHSSIAKYFHSGIGLRLQAVDADIAEDVIRQLLKKGVVAFPVHDSFIVRERYKPVLQGIMEDALDKADSVLLKIVI